MWRISWSKPNLHLKASRRDNDHKNATLVMEIRDVMKYGIMSHEMASHWSYLNNFVIPMELQIKFLLENLKGKLDWFNNSTCKSSQYTFYALRMFRIETSLYTFQEIKYNIQKGGLHFRQMNVKFHESFWLQIRPKTYSVFLKEGG